MPIYAKKQMPGTWRVVVWTGNQSREKLVTGSKEEAETYEARWRLQLRAEDPKERRVAPSFSVFCREEYRLHAELEFSPQWILKQRYMLVQIAKILGDVKLDQLRTDDIKAYAAERLSRGMRRSSVNNELRVISGVVNYARGKGYTVPAEVKQIRNTEARRAKAWTLEQVSALMWGCAVRDDRQLAAMVKFLVNTGCRKGEALAARRDWVDLDRRLLTIRPGPYWKPKSGKPREVPLSDSMDVVLRFSAESGTDWLFPSPNGKPYAYWPALRFDKARDAAGLTGGPHTLRHTFASLFLQKQPDLGLLAQILGHSTTRVTELYTHFLPGHLERARGAVDV